MTVLPNKHLEKTVLLQLATVSGVLKTQSVKLHDVGVNEPEFRKVHPENCVSDQDELIPGNEHPTKVFGVVSSAELTLFPSKYVFVINIFASDASESICVLVEEMKQLSMRKDPVCPPVLDTKLRVSVAEIEEFLKTKLIGNDVFPRKSTLVLAVVARIYMLSKLTKFPNVVIPLNIVMLVEPLRIMPKL